MKFSGQVENDRRNNIFGIWRIAICIQDLFSNFPGEFVFVSNITETIVNVFFFFLIFGRDLSYKERLLKIL